MKATLKRKEIPAIIAGLAKVNGMKDFKKAISLGRDSRKLKEVQDATEDAFKKCKPADYDTLSDELRDLKQKEAKKIELKDGEILNDNAIGQHVLLTWPKASAWAKANKEYNERADAISSEIVEIDFHTELLEKDLPKSAENMDVAEALSYFMK